MLYYRHPLHLKITKKNNFKGFHGSIDVALEIRIGMWKSRKRYIGWKVLVLVSFFGFLSLQLKSSSFYATIEGKAITPLYRPL